MVEIEEKERETFEAPKEITPKNVCYYSHHFKAIVDEYGNKKANVLNGKAKLFVEHNCIRYDPDEKCYYCDALGNYNHRNYKLSWNKDLKRWECNCQGFVTKDRQGEINPVCSHLLALMYYFKIHPRKGKDL